MSAKEEKPTLAGVQVKTRKRNIVVPSDPGSFANAIVQIFQDASDGVSIETDLEAATKVLESSDLDFQRYGTTLFEVLFAGGRLATGGNLADDSAKLATHVFAAGGDRESLAPYIKVFMTLTRRRPFLNKSLENTLIKFILTLEFYDDAARNKLATALAVVFALKIGVNAENIFNALFIDRLIAKGTILEFFTTFVQEFLKKDSVEDLVSVFTKGKVAHRLVEYFPPSKRSTADFNAHFKAAGLDNLVEWNTKRDIDAKLKELQENVKDMISAEAAAADVVAVAVSKRTEHSLPDTEILAVSWTALMESVNMTGKNQQQITQSVTKSVKTYRTLFSTFATSGKTELSLLLHIQVYCYEDNRLLKQFSEIVRVLYECDIVGEDTVMHWYKKGSHPKGRNVFIKDIEPFIKWLEEAEEEDDD